jgi:hypothetical protein
VLDVGFDVGHHARIGLEDTLVLPDGSTARDNGDLVAAAVALARDHGRVPPAARLRSAPLGSRLHRFSPHSRLPVPDQRPARGCSPASTRRVHGAQPMEVYPSYSSGFTSTSWSAM